MVILLIIMKKSIEGWVKIKMDSKVNKSLIGISTAIKTVYEKMKQRSKNKNFNYQKIEVELPFGCNSLRVLCIIESEFSKAINETLVKLKSMKQSSKESGNEENKKILEGIQEETDYMAEFLIDEVTKVTPSLKEVKSFMLYATRSVKNISSLERSMKDLEKEKNSKDYNSEYKKAIKLTLILCKDYFKVYTKMMSIMDKYLKDKDK